MERFHIIDEAEVITVSRSVFNQRKVYRRGAGLYVGHGSGFVRLYYGGRTGLPNLSWDEIDIPGISAVEISKDDFGKLSLTPAMTKQIEAQANK